MKIRHGERLIDGHRKFKCFESIREGEDAPAILGLFTIDLVLNSGLGALA